jgi:REP element-mobilizing transposase RayT
MPFNPARHHRRSIRLPHYDYGAAGTYFVTIVTAHRECLFTDLHVRSIVERAWLGIPRFFPHAALDAWVVMPNHLHGIVVLTRRRSEAGCSGSLGAILGTFKSITARRLNRLRRTPGVPVWQRNYYERVIRNETELDRIRAYIAANPLRWALDRENPERISTADEWTAQEDQWFTSSDRSEP